MAKEIKKPNSSTKDPAEATALGHCLSENCKKTVARFGFCNEHFEQFKFGLIRKTGEPVPDFEKKFEHYQAYRTKVGSKVA